LILILYKSAMNNPNIQNNNLDNYEKELILNTDPNQELYDILKTNIWETEQMLAQKELQELWIETSTNNINALLEQQNTPQHPKGFEDITSNFNNPEELKKLMIKMWIKSIVHSEWINVWDHSKMAINEIESMQIPEETKKDLKLIMEYHDLGKTTSRQNTKNIEQTQKKLEKWELHQAMIGHQKEKLVEIESGFKANWVDGQKLKIFMTVVENHMNTSLLEQDPKKTVNLFETFWDNEEEIKKVVELLTLVLQADGNATQHIDLIDGELKYSKNEKKLKLDFASVWKKYEEWKNILQQEEEKKNKQESESAFEILIFGKKLFDYLSQNRGIKPWPEMGKSISKIKNIILENKDKSPEEIKKIIDVTEI